jgi:hypothetical protein
MTEWKKGKGKKDWQRARETDNWLTRKRKWCKRLRNTGPVSIKGWAYPVLGNIKSWDGITND